MFFKEEMNLKWVLSEMQGFPGLKFFKLFTHLLCCYQAINGRVEGYLEDFLILLCYYD